jgi:hypothetical protein
MRGGHGWLASAGASSELHSIDARPAAGIVALVFAVLAGLALVALLRSRRLSPIAPGGASIELRPESPAVVDLLTGGFEVDDDSVPATVVHLAARRWFTIEDYGPDTIIRTRTMRPTNDTRRCRSGDASTDGRREGPDDGDAAGPRRRQHAHRQVPRSVSAGQRQPQLVGGR